MDAREIIADLAGRYVDHYDEMSLLDDSQKVMVPVKLLRLAYEKAMGVSHSQALPVSKEHPTQATVEAGAK